MQPSMHSLILVACLSAPLPLTAADRPNVLLILADDLGYSDLGCYGGEIPTPNIDRLARGGVRFSQLYTSARCCPTRASLMTGLTPHNAGIGSMADLKVDPRRGPGYLGHLNDKCTTLARVARAAGYQTWMVGKWHMGQPGPIRQGFEEFFGYVRGHSHDQWDASFYKRLPESRTPEFSATSERFYATQSFNDYALSFLEQARAKPNQPWFLYVAHSSPHFPVQAPAERTAKFLDIYRRGWDVLRAERFARMQKMGLADSTWTFTERSMVPVDRDDIASGYSGQPNPAWDTLPADRREDLAHRMAIFAAMVSYVDDGVGQLVSSLEQHGDLENTVVIFLSDNGACYEWGPFGFDGESRRGKTTLHTGPQLDDMGGPGTYHAYGSAWANLGNTPFRMYKHFTYEGGISTPFIVHWPAGVKSKNSWNNTPAHVMDLMPTLCDLIGAKYPASEDGRQVLPMEGTSLVPLLHGEALPERELFFEHEGARAVRHGRWKAVRSKRLPQEAEWELYDLSSDRCETTNLAEKFPDRLKTMADHWQAWAERSQVIRGR